MDCMKDDKRQKEVSGRENHVMQNRADNRKITFAAQYIQSLRVSGKNTKISTIREYGDKLLPYQDPDNTIYRKYFNDSVFIIIEYKGTDNNVKREITRRKSIKKLRRKDKKLTKEEKERKERAKEKKREKKREKKKAALVKSQHDKKVKEIIAFLDTHYLTTNYFYTEIKRIERQRTVKDDLRLMVEYLENPDKEKMKMEVFDYYLYKRMEEASENSVRVFDPNNMVINILKDPYNDGVKN